MQVGGDETSKRRPKHRPEQRRDGEPGKRRDHLGLGNAAQNNEAPDRHHHRTAQALNDPVEHEFRQAMRQAAKSRAASENRNGRHEDRARAVFVGNPAADGNEYRKAQQIACQREFQRDRGDMQIGRDCRQGGGENRRIEVLHEQAAGHDQWNKHASGHRILCLPPGRPGKQKPRWNGYRRDFPRTGGHNGPPDCCIEQARESGLPGLANSA